MTARVTSVTAASTSPGKSVSVSPTPTNTTVAPLRAAAAATQWHPMSGTITSWPGPTRRISSAISIAAVPEARSSASPWPTRRVSRDTPTSRIGMTQSLPGLRIRP